MISKSLAPETPEPILEKKPKKPKIHDWPNYIHRQRRVHKVKKHSLKTTVSLVLICFSLGFWTGWALNSARLHLVRGTQNWKQSQHFLKKFDLSEANHNFKQTLNELKTTRKRLSLIGFLKQIPWLGHQVHAATDILDTTIVTGETLDQLIELTVQTPLAFRKLDPRKIDPEAAQSSLTDVKKASQLITLQILPNLNRAIQTIENVKTNDNTLPILRELKLKLEKNLHDFKDILITSAPLLEILPDISAYNTTKNYLFLFINNNNATPGGGMVIGQAKLEVSNGRLTEIKLEDSYSFDQTNWKKSNNPHLSVAYSRHQQNTAQMIKTSQSQPTFLFNSLISPDFPTNLAKIINLNNQQKNPTQYDAALAITPEVILDLIDFMGGYLKFKNKTYSTQQILELLTAESKISGTHKEQIVLQIGNQIFDQLLQTPAERWPQLIKVITTNLTEKHILIHYQEPKIQTTVQQNNWNGQLKNTDSDYLLITENNPEYHQPTPQVTRKATYTIETTNQQTVATLTLNYNNPQSKTYQSYTKIYLPEGSNLIKTTGTSYLKTGLDFNKKVIGTLIKISPQTSQEISFTYLLPARIQTKIDQGNYQLLWQKQIGSPNTQNQLQLDFNQNLTFAHPAEDSEYFDDQSYHQNFELKEDSLFTLELIPLWTK